MKPANNGMGPFLFLLFSDAFTDLVNEKRAKGVEPSLRERTLLAYIAGILNHPSAVHIVYDDMKSVLHGIDETALAALLLMTPESRHDLVKRAYSQVNQPTTTTTTTQESN